MKRVVVMILLLFTVMGMVSSGEKKFPWNETKVIIKVIFDESAGKLKYEIEQHEHSERFYKGHNASLFWADRGWAIEWHLDPVTLLGKEIELEWDKGGIDLFDHEEYSQDGMAKVQIKAMISTTPPSSIRCFGLSVSYAVIIKENGREWKRDDPDMIIEPGGGGP